MKSLVVFYSRTNTTKTVAESIAKLLKADTEEITSVKDRSGPMGYIISGKEAVLKQLAEIEQTKINPKDYDLIIIGTPVWGWTMSSPVRTYLTKNKDLFKKIAFFCTMGGSGDEKTFKHMEDICNKKPVATLALKTKEVKQNKYSVKEFVNKL